MKLLVLVQNYPSKDSHNRMYVHVRNKYYVKNNIDVTVLNFSSKENYVYDDIKVITLDYFKKNKKEYDILCLHAPNIKNHYKFLNKYGYLFKKYVFFFHGQEILKWNKDYPEEYSFKKKNIVKKIFRNFYDELKFILWRKKIKKIIDRSYLIFVSNYLFKKFLKYIKIDLNLINKHYSIINNPVGEIFENNNYDYESKKEFDFITIRGEGLDHSKYGIDIVTNLANKNPNYKFLVIGSGNYYNFNKKPKNITFKNEILTHEDIIKYANKAKYALMPTKQDTQGVLSCELVTFGIPLITSDIEITNEIFNNFSNVYLIKNFDIISLDNLLKTINYKKTKTKKYFYEYTTKNEIKIIKELL